MNDIVPPVQAKKNDKTAFEVESHFQERHHTVQGRGCQEIIWVLELGTYEMWVGGGRLLRIAAF